MATNPPGKDEHCRVNVLLYTHVCICTCTCMHIYKHYEEMSSKHSLNCLPALKLTKPCKSVSVTLKQMCLTPLGTDSCLLHH